MNIKYVDLYVHIQIYIFICKYVYKHEYIYIYKYTYLSVDMYMNIYCACSTVSSLYKVASHWETHSAHCNTLKHPAIQFLGLLKLSFTLLSLLMCVFDWLIHMCVFLIDSFTYVAQFMCSYVANPMCCDMTHSPNNSIVLRYDVRDVQHDLCNRVTWHIYMCDMTHDMCDVTHSPNNSMAVRYDVRDVRHDSFICATWLIPLCDLTHVSVRHDLLICAIWHIPQAIVW